MFLSRCSLPVCLLLILALMPGGVRAEGEAAAPDARPAKAVEKPSTAGEKSAAGGGVLGEEEAISVSNGLLSVRLENAGLLDVMKDLSKKSGIRIKLDKGASKRISLTFRDMPFDKGIRNLIRPLSYAMIWSKTKGENGVVVEELQELHVFREGHQGGATVDLGPDDPEEGSGGKVQKRVWSEETRRRMLEKLRVTPSSP